jgi:hypothetical protein
MEWFFMGLRYVIISLPFIFAVVFALVGFWMLIATTSRVTAGAWVVGVAFLVETAFVVAPYIPMGIKVSTDDLAFALLASALFARVLFVGFPQWGTIYGMWLTIGAVFFISLGVGLAEFGTPAGVEARSNFYFWMAGLYFASFSYPPDVLKKLWRITQWCAWLVAAIVVYRWVGLKFGFVSARLVEFAGASSEFRVVGSNPAFFLAVTGAAYFALWLRDSKRTALLAAVLMLGLVLVLQHRSVWVAALGALGVLAWHARAAVSAKAFPFIGMAVVALGLAATFIALDPSSRLTETLTQSAVSVTESRGTHIDRLVGWQELLADFAQSEPHNWLLGKPYGSGYERYVLGRLQEFSPHNFYLQLLLRLGAAGLLLFLWVHFVLRHRIRVGMSAGLVDPMLQSVFLAVMAASLLYYIPYQGFYLQGAFYGVLMGYLATRPQALAASIDVRPVYGLGEAR